MIWRRRPEMPMSSAIAKCGLVRGDAGRGGTKIHPSPYLPRCWQKYRPLAVSAPVFEDGGIDCPRASKRYVSESLYLVEYCQWDGRSGRVVLELAPREFFLAVIESAGYRGSSRISLLRISRRCFVVSQVLMSEKRNWMPSQGLKSANAKRPRSRNLTQLHFPVVEL